MSIWSKCINRLTAKKREKKDCATKVNDYSGLYVYSQDQLYLGAEGHIITNDGKYFAIFSYTVRDGIMWKLTKYRPYSRLFEYYDGSIMINDENNDLFTSFAHELQMLSRDSNQKTEDIFANLKNTSLSFFDTYIRSFGATT